MSNTDGQSGLLIRFGYPAGAFLYGSTSPRLEIDGVEVEVPGWGEHVFPVSPGAHGVKVWVPYVMPRRVGRATAHVEVAEGGRVELEYMAPTVTFAKGSLGVPGEQKSAGFRPVMALNVLAAIVMVIGLIVVLTN